MSKVDTIPNYLSLVIRREIPLTQSEIISAYNGDLSSYANNYNVGTSYFVEDGINDSQVPTNTCTRQKVPTWADFETYAKGGSCLIDTYNGASATTFTKFGELSMNASDGMTSYCFNMPFEGLNDIPVADSVISNGNHIHIKESDNKLMIYDVWLTPYKPYTFACQYVHENNQIKCKFKWYGGGGLLIPTMEGITTHDTMSMKETNEIEMVSYEWSEVETTYDNFFDGMLSVVPVVKNDKISLGIIFKYTQDFQSTTIFCDNVYNDTTVCNGGSVANDINIDGIYRKYYADGDSAEDEGIDENLITIQAIIQGFDININDYPNWYPTSDTLRYPYGFPSSSNSSKFKYYEYESFDFNKRKEITFNDLYHHDNTISVANYNRSGYGNINNCKYPSLTDFANNDKDGIDLQNFEYPVYKKMVIGSGVNNYNYYPLKTSDGITNVSSYKNTFSCTNIDINYEVAFYTRTENTSDGTENQKFKYCNNFLNLSDDNTIHFFNVWFSEKECLQFMLFYFKGDKWSSFNSNLQSSLSYFKRPTSNIIQNDKYYVAIKGINITRPEGGNGYATRYGSIYPYEYNSDYLVVNECPQGKIAISLVNTPCSINAYNGIERLNAGWIYDYDDTQAISNVINNNTPKSFGGVYLGIYSSALNLYETVTTCKFQLGGTDVPNGTENIKDKNNNPDEGGGSSKIDNGDPNNTDDPYRKPNYIDRVDRIEPVEPRQNNIANTGLITMYKLTEEDLRNLSADLFDDSVINTLKKGFTRPLDAILKLSECRVKARYTSNRSLLKLGNANMLTTQGNKITKDVLTYDLGRVAVRNRHGNYLDYQLKCGLYLPFIGFKYLDKFVVNKSIHIKYICNFINGNVLVIITADDVNDNKGKSRRGNTNGYCDKYLIDTFSGNMFTELPLGSTSNDKLLSSFASISIGLAMHSTSMGIANAIAGTPQSMYPTYNQVSDIGRNNATIEQYYKPILYTWDKNTPWGRTYYYNESFNGCSKHFISSLPSPNTTSTQDRYFYKVSANVKIDTITKTENDMINDILKNGFYKVKNR